MNADNSEIRLSKQQIHKDSISKIQFERCITDEDKAQDVSDSNF